MSMILDLLDAHKELQRERQPYEAHWQEVTERICPGAQDIVLKRKEGTQRSPDRNMDSTAGLALDRFAALMLSMVFPSGAKWHSLAVLDQRRKTPSNTRYLEGMRDFLFEMRYRHAAGFGTAAHELMQSLGGYGAAVLHIDEVVGVGARYRSVPLRQMYWRMDSWGQALRVHREYDLSAQEALREFPDSLPKLYRDQAQRADCPRLKFLECVKPADDGPLRGRGFAWETYTLAVDVQDESGIVSQGGYMTMPYIPCRYRTNSGDNYGRSPAWMAMPEVRMVAEIQRTTIRAFQNRAIPPLLLSDDGMLEHPFSLQPGSLNFGWLGNDGSEKAKALMTGADPAAGVAAGDQARRTINDHFLVTLFQILLEDTTQRTATEVLERVAEKGQLAAPTIERLTAELLDPQITRELDIVERNELFAPAPPGLLDTPLRIDYHSWVRTALQAPEAAATARWLETVYAGAAFDKSILDIADMPEAYRRMGKGWGVPEAVMRSADEVKAMAEGRQQAEQQAAMMEAAPGMARAARDVAEARAAGGGMPL